MADDCLFVNYPELDQYQPLGPISTGLTSRPGPISPLVAVSGTIAMIIFSTLL